MTLKMVVLALIPMARESTATSVKPGLLRILRMAYRRSWPSVSIQPVPIVRFSFGADSPNVASALIPRSGH
jgi:hypothetical protein